MIISLPHPTDTMRLNEGEGDLGHMVAHCDDSRTLCGLRTENMPEGVGGFDNDPNPCVVCDQMDLARFCALCGKDWDA